MLQADLQCLAPFGLVRRFLPLQSTARRQHVIYMLIPPAPRNISGGSGTDPPFRSVVDRVRRARVSFRRVLTLPQSPPPIERVGSPSFFLPAPAV